MKVQIKSIFEQISEKVFTMSSLNEAKSFIIDFVETKQINEVDKKGIIMAVNGSKTLTKLQMYICNSLLKYEGMGMNQISKTAKEAAADETTAAE
jgi:hypothetical protein